MNTTSPMLLALHCSASGPAQWNPYRVFGAPGVRWHTPALLGYGEGAGWHAGMPLSLEDEAWRLLPFLQRSGFPVDIVGHSFGGAVALKVAASWPELVRSVTVYEPVLFGVLQEDPTSEEPLREAAAVADDVRRLVRRGENEAAAERFVDYWSPQGSWARMPRQRQLRVSGFMPKVAAEFRALFDARLDLSRVEAGPAVRIVAGTASPAPVRRIAEVLHWQIAGSSIVHVAGAGHMAPLVSPQKMADLLLPESAMAWPLAA
jgi:pimeloyl-ACP methyl ester carboxylesterase